MKTFGSFHFIFLPKFYGNVFSCIQLTTSWSISKAHPLTDFGVFMQVFAFVKSDQSNDSPHRADCHVCESLLEFRTKVEVIDLLMPKLFLCFLFKELNMQISIVRLTYFLRVSWPNKENRQNTVLHFAYSPRGLLLKYGCTGCALDVEL
jgi:hypothetical protein